MISITVGAVYASNLFLTVAAFAGAIAIVQANEATVQSSMEKIEKARELLAEAKKDLMSDEKYNC